jgi:hypothetical protein
VISFWSAKGGAGVSTTVALTAAALANRNDTTLLVDAVGDLPAVLATTSVPAAGLCDWLQAPDVDVNALRRVMVPLSERLTLLGLGSSGQPRTFAVERLHALEDAYGGASAVVDAGRIDFDTDLGAALASVSSISVLVTRACYVALRRATDLSLSPDAVVLIEEAGRVLSRRDVEDVLDARVIAVVPWSTSICGAVDSGRLLSSRRVMRFADELAETLLAMQGATR